MNKQQIIDLWRLSFDDSEAFIRLYFERVYREEHTLVIEKGGQVVSALQMLPYTMTYYGTEITMAYISGACTLPSMQGKGLMKELLQQAFEVMKSKSIAVTTLIPAESWLFDYYRAQGYTEVFDYAETVYTRPTTPVCVPQITLVPGETLPIDVLYDYFNRKLQERTCCVQHTQADFITILHDLQLQDGQLLTALHADNRLVGMAFVFPPDGVLPEQAKQIEVKEILYDDNRIANLLLQEAILQNKADQAVCKQPPSTPASHPFGMARLIDTEQMIHHWLSTHQESSYTEQALKSMDTQTRTQTLLGYPGREAYMSLMLD